MLRRTILVEPSLSNVKSILEAEGFRTLELSPGTMVRGDAIVITGLDSNIMNIQDIETDVPVINASGKTPAEIVEEIYNYIMPDGEEEDIYFEYTLPDEDVMNTSDQRDIYGVPGQDTVNREDF